jgi:hypothetical protein
MEGGLASVGISEVRVGTTFNQELAEPPVSVERCGIQPKVLAERFQALPLRQQEADGAHVAVIRSTRRSGSCHRHPEK